MTFDWTGPGFPLAGTLVGAWGRGFFLTSSTIGLGSNDPALVTDWARGASVYLADNIQTWTSAPEILPDSFEADAHAGATFTATLVLPVTLGLVVPASPLAIEWGKDPSAYLAGGAIATWSQPYTPPIVPASFEADARATATFAPAVTLTATFGASAHATARFTGPLIAGTFAANARATARFAGSLVSPGSTVSATFAIASRAGATFDGRLVYRAALECDGVATAIFWATLLGAGGGPPPDPLTLGLIPWTCEIGAGGLPVKWQAGRLIKNPPNYAC